MWVYLANPKGFHRFLPADLKHEGVVHTAVISAGNSIIVTGSQAASIQVGREESWASYQAEASLTDPAYRICPWASKRVVLISSNLSGGWICSSEHVSSTATLLKRRWPLTLPLHCFKPFCSFIFDTEWRALYQFRGQASSQCMPEAWNTISFLKYIKFELLKPALLPICEQEPDGIHIWSTISCQRKR